MLATASPNRGRLKRPRYTGNDPVNFRDPTGMSQAGNPLNNLFGGYSGNRVAPEKLFVDSQNALQSPFLDINRCSALGTLGRVTGNALATTLRSTHPIGTSVINTGVGLGALSLFGPVSYEPGKEYSAGRVSQSGKTFILNDPILNAAGKPQRTAPIVGGSLDLRAFSAGEVEIAITGSNIVDRATARELYRVKYGSVPEQGKTSGQIFHHGPQTGTVVENGVTLPVARMQLVPRDVNALFPHEGTAAVARREIGAQGVLAARVRASARAYNASALESIKTGRGSAGALSALTVYMAGRDVLQETGFFRRDYTPVANMEYVFDDGRGSTFTVQPRGWFSSATKTYLGGSRSGRVETIDTSTADRYRRTAEAKYGRYIPGSLLRDPRFIPGTDRQSIDYIDYRGITAGYIDETGAHPYSPQEAYRRSGI